MEGQQGLAHGVHVGRSQGDQGHGNQSHFLVGYDQASVEVMPFKCEVPELVPRLVLWCDLYTTNIAITTRTKTQGPRCRHW